MKQYFKWILGVLTCLSLVACTNPHSPEGVAKKFWDGVLAQDQEVVRKYSTTSTQASVDFTQNKIDWKNMELTLGSAEVVNNQATVHTLILNKETGARYAFNTYLVQENNEWRVDYVQTRQASITSEIFADLISSLVKFNNGLNNNFDETVAGFREASPEIKKELDQLTATLANHMRETSKQTDPNVHSKMQSFKEDVMNIFAHHSDHSQTVAPAPMPIPAQ
ncbi:MAG: hypothetical protein WC748_02210 [Legionellales bacterium]|jgi:hypothetical protein